MDVAACDRRIAAVRRFNRFYTQKIGVLQDAWLHLPFSLTEARVLYELAHRDGATATWLGRELGLDPGYLSRILRGFQRQKLIARVPSPQDGRQSLISLTAAGRDAFAPIDQASHGEIGGMLARLPEPDQERLVGAMRTVASLLDSDAEPAVAYVLRPHRAGDMG
jgi:DNA-binding MarR family transcriptional regulator